MFQSNLSLTRLLIRLLSVTRGGLEPFVDGESVCTDGRAWKICPWWRRNLTCPLRKKSEKKWQLRLKNLPWQV